MSYSGAQVTVTPDGSHDVITLVENGRTVTSQRVPVEVGPGGSVVYPSKSAFRMVQESPEFGPSYTVCWEGQGFSVHLR
jgi:hypothetical protein